MIKEMNYAKIQQEALKVLSKGKEKHKCLCSLDDKYAYITYDTIAIYKIPLDEFFLSFPKIDDRALKMFNLLSEDIEATYTGNYKKLSDKKLAVILYRGEHENAYIDSKIFKNFENCYDKITCAKKSGPAIFYRGNEKIGCVYTMSVKD